MEFWDAVHHATGIKSSTNVWFFGPTVEQELAVCRWSDEHAPGSYVCTLVRIRPSAARSGHNTTINLIEGDRGDDDTGAATMAQGRWPWHRHIGTGMVAQPCAQQQLQGTMA